MSATFIPFEPRRVTRPGESALHAQRTRVPVLDPRGVVGSTLAPTPMTPVRGERTVGNVPPRTQVTRPGESMGQGARGVGTTTARPDTRARPGAPSQFSGPLIQGQPDLLPGDVSMIDGVLDPRTIDRVRGGGDEFDSDIAGLLDLLFGMDDGFDPSAIGATFDPEIEALRAMIAGLDDHALARREGIEQVFGAALSGIDPAREQVGEAFDTAGENIGEIYDESAERLAGTADFIGVEDQHVRDRIAAASAPFIDANVSDRASTLTNLERHRAGGEQYFGSLEAAIPAESAQAQAQSDFAIQQQQFQIQQQMAGLEGAKQRAIMEATADNARDVQERMMRIMAFEALGFGGNEAAALGILGGQGLQAMNMMMQGQEGMGMEDEGMSPLEQIQFERAQTGLARDQLNLQDAATGGVAEMERQMAALGVNQRERQIAEIVLNELGSMGADFRDVNDVVQMAQEMIAEIDAEMRAAGPPRTRVSRPGESEGQREVSPHRVTRAVLMQLGLA